MRRPKGLKEEIVQFFLRNKSKSYVEQMLADVKRENEIRGFHFHKQDCIDQWEYVLWRMNHRNNKSGRDPFLFR